jgi:prevent-host-death family protein
MRTVSSADARNRFGELLDTAQREPATIEKHGRPVADIHKRQDPERRLQP